MSSFGFGGTNSHVVLESMPRHLDSMEHEGFTAIAEDEQIKVRC